MLVVQAQVELVDRFHQDMYSTHLDTIPMLSGSLKLNEKYSRALFIPFGQGTFFYRIAAANGGFNGKY